MHNFLLHPDKKSPQAVFSLLSHNPLSTEPSHTMLHMPLVELCADTRVCCVCESLLCNAEKLK